MRKPNFERLLARRPESIFVNPFGSLRPAGWDWRAWCRSAATVHISGPVKALDKGEEPAAPGDEPGDGRFQVIATYC